MTKWADYLISGIWEETSNESTHISHVFLHVDTASGFGNGIKTSRADVVKILRSKKTVKTMSWSYVSAKWIKGADVGIVVDGGKEYLRSHRDGTVSDNLDNLIRMSDFFENE